MAQSQEGKEDCLHFERSTLSDRNCKVNESNCETEEINEIINVLEEGTFFVSDLEDLD